MRLIVLCGLFFNLLLAQESIALDNAFKNGTVRGNITLFSYNIDKKNDQNSYASALGGFLKYSTDTQKTLSATVGFHQSSSIGPNQNKITTQLFNNDQNASTLTAISESFIAYKNKNSLLKIGNLLLNTPMMNNDTTRIVPWSYQGISLISQSLPHTKIQLNHITQIRKNTSGEYNKESGSGDFDNGISMLAITYEGIDNLSLHSYYYYAPELYSTFIAQLDYKNVQNEDFLFCWGAQYFKSGNGGKYNDTLSANGGDNIDLLAVNVGINGPKYDITLNYSQNFGLSGIIKGYGGLAKVYTTSMIANGRVNFKPETWMLKSRFDMDPFQYGQSELALWLTNTRVHDNRGDDFDAFYTHLRHYFNANTSLYLRFEAIDYHYNTSSVADVRKDDVKHLRLIASFDF